LARYMEAASIEALVEDMETVTVLDHSRRKRSFLASNPITRYDSYDEEQERNDAIQASVPLSATTKITASPNTEHGQSKSKSTVLLMSSSTIPDLLRDCGGVPLSIEQLSTHWLHSEAALVTAIIHSQEGKALEPLSFSYHIGRTLPDTDALLLFALFGPLAHPSPTIASIQQIILNEKERGRHKRPRMKKRTNNGDNSNIPLPCDALISASAAQKKSIVSLLQSQDHLLKLPKYFQLAFFRILIRLLTNETDDEYDDACLLTSESWDQDDETDSTTSDHTNETWMQKRQHLGITLGSILDENSTSSFQVRTHERIQRMRKTRETLDQQRKHHSMTFEAKGQLHQQFFSQRPYQVYAIVRFRTGEVWNRCIGSDHGNNHAVSCILNLFESILDQEPSHHLLGPVSRLLGLLCTAGIAVKELRRMLAMSGDTIPSEGSPLRRCAFDRLLLIRALATAAEGASKSSQLLCKASPRYFFSFRKGPGLTRTMKSLPSWPFRNDFGMACWFRVEAFDGKDNARLLSCRAPDGGGIEVALQQVDGDSKASVITVTTYDSNVSHHGHHGVQQVKLNCCLILPRVWYHLAIRHTQSRLKGVFSLGARQNLTIMLDGKVLLTEPLKFPSITYSDAEVPSPSNLLGLRRSANTTTLTVQFGADFEGQTGALYLFNDNISDATLRALHEVTAGTRGIAKHDQMKDNHQWNSVRGDNTRKLASVVEIATVDAEEIAMTSSCRDRKQEILNPTNALVVDLGEEEGSSDFPIELSKASLSARIFLVWDPKRTEGSVALDLHSGAHVIMDTDKVLPWFVEGAQKVIGSLGGVQALLPVFESLLSGKVEREWHMMQSADSNDFDPKTAYPLIPNLIALLSAFIKDNAENAREIIRCGGIDIIENFLLLNKTQQSCSSNSGTNPCETMLGVLALHYKLSSRLLDALVDLRASCSQYEVLETTVFTRLYFNMPLWFDESHGVGHHVTLLPLLSSVAKSSPMKVRDCVGTKTLIEALKLYIQIDKEHLKHISHEAGTQLFDRSSMSGLDPRAPLTIMERRHAVDIILGIVANILAIGTNPTLLSPLINYIAHSVDHEHDLAVQDVVNGKDPLIRKGERQEMHLAAVKATSVLLFLLKGRPTAPGILPSLTKICGGPHATSSWIVCAIINSCDDELRSLGIRCLAEYMDAEHACNQGIDQKSKDFIGSQGQTTIETGARPVGKRLTITITNMGKGLASIGGAPLLSSIIQPGTDDKSVCFKLLWHLLKSHKIRIGPKTHSSLVNLLLQDRGVIYSPSFLVQECVISDEVLRAGYALSINAVETILLECESVSGKKLRQGPALNIVLRLIRFLSDEWKEKWLLDLLDLISTCPGNLAVLVACSEWQPSLFHLISDSVEDIASTSETNRLAVSTNAIDFPSETGSPSECHSSVERAHVETRFDLSLKLYSCLLGYCFRHGGEKALHCIEYTASLERVCANGQEVVCLIMNHLLANLMDYGTVEAISVTSPNRETMERNKLLRESARIVTNAILANGSNLVDAASAVRQWQSLRHLAATSSAIVTKSGFTMGELFDYSSQSGSAIDNFSMGVYGIRLPEYNVPGINSTEYVKLIQNVPYSADCHARSRRVSLAVAAQILTLLDAFIFPDSLDASLPASQLHGLALVRSNEARLGKSLGPLIASLMRLSLTLMCHLEPSSVKFLQCCSRLRCFVHWSLELIRESVGLAGYSAAFHDLTAPLDRLVLATVLQCHRSLAKCATILTEIESSPKNIYFPNDDSKKKNYRRLLRVSFELREILLAAYRGRNEVLRAALSHEAFEALQSGLEQSLSGNGSRYPRNVGPPVSKEATVRTFLSCTWVKSFHDVDMHDTLAIPEQVANGQVLEHRTSSHRGVLAIEEMALESSDIVQDFNRVLDTSFDKYCEDQRKWANTGAVRELEFEGDSTSKKLSSKHQMESAEIGRMIIERANSASSRWYAVERIVVELWNCESSHWQLARHADRLNRRILLTRNRDFDDHQQASYELMLGIERDKAMKLREERLRKKQEEDMSDVLDVVRRNSGAMVRFGEFDDAIHGNGEDGEDDENDNETEDSVFLLAQNDSVQRKTTSFLDGLELKVVTNTESVFGVDGDVVMVEDEDAQIVDSDAWAKVFIWSDSESIVARFDGVMIVTLQTITEGNLLLTTHGLYFRQSGSITNVVTKESGSKIDNEKFEKRDTRWRLNRLTEVHGRRFMLRAQAIELFFSDSHELFINFTNGLKDRDRFFAKLRNSCKVPMLWSPKSLNPRVVFKKSNLTQLWRMGKISNFCYLMQLNKMAGRTFNDITQYPVFPWILSDFTSDTIDLQDTRVYRDLSKPVGALNENRLSALIERFNELESFGFAENERFLYGSHYSSPGVVLHYLIRQEPFTTMAIELQSGRFDCPDRLFFDIASCWRSCNTSTSDVKELVPELFTCPEVFLNTNNYPLGRTQETHSIDNVKLPPWANGSAYEFVRIHRLALESEYVSQNLHHWIDLIFGCKQRGPEAEAAHNLFHYLSYEGAVDLDKITDDIDRAATESHIQNFGQTPSQLLIKEAHSPRYPRSDRWNFLIHSEAVPRHLRCHTPRKQFGGSKNGQTKGAVVSIQVMSDTVFAVYSDMSVGTYKWGPSRNAKHPFMIRMDKHKVIGGRELSTSRSAIIRGSAAPQSMEDSNSCHSIGNWSICLTLGGEAKEILRRKTQMQSSRLTSSAKDVLSAAEVNSLLVSCGYWDDCIKVHSVDGLRLQCSDNGGHRGPIRCLALGDDGALMVTGGQDTTCRVWVVDHPDMAVALSGGYVKTALGKNTDGERILACCHVLWGHVAPVTCIAISSDLDVVVSGSLEGNLCVHRVRRGKFVRSIRTPNYDGDRPNAVRKLVLDSSGTLIAHMEDCWLHAMTVNGVHLCSVDAGEKLQDMKVTSNGEILITGGDHCQLVFRACRNLEVLSVLDISRHGPIRCIALTPDDLNPIPQFLFVGSDDGMITVVEEDPMSNDSDVLAFD